MARAVKYRNVERALRDQGCIVKSTRGSHEKWICPCGRHSTIIVRGSEVSPGVVRDAINKLTCLPEGWLQ